MYFQHAPEIWRDFPQLVPGVLLVQGITAAVRETTTAVLLVAEGLHASAPADVAKLTATLADEISAVWSVPLSTAILSASSPRLEW